MNDATREALKILSEEAMATGQQLIDFAYADPGMPGSRFEANIMAGSGFRLLSDKIQARLGEPKLL